MKSMFLFLWVAVSSAALCESRFSTDVRIVISATQPMADELESYLRRELRALQDCTLVSTNETIRISVVGMQNKSQSGVALGYTLSVVCTSHHSRDSAEAVAKVIAAPGMEKAMVSTLTTQCKPQGHWLFACSIKDLKETAEQIVATVDTNVLQVHREDFEYVRKLIKQSAPTKSEP